MPTSRFPEVAIASSDDPHAWPEFGRPCFVNTLVHVVQVVRVVLVVLPQFGGHSLVAHRASEGVCSWSDPTDGPKSFEKKP
jgi:hypothetical protein